MQVFNQLPEGCDWEGGAMTIWESTGSVLWSAIWVRTEVATASALEVELTPLEVLTELCWIASVCGLLGTDMSSELSSLSAAEEEKVIIFFSSPRMHTTMSQVNSNHPLNN